MSRHAAIVVLAVIFLAGSLCSAHAGSIAGRFGITGQAGFLIPVDSTYTDEYATANHIADTNLSPDGAFAGGGGVIFGLTKTLALEATVIYSPEIDFDNGGNKVFELETTDVSIGLQLRNNVSEDTAAYLGFGADVLFSDIRDANGVNGDVDTVYGGHLNVGGDYFITKNLALNLDLRGLFFPETDIKAGSGSAVKYNPISFVGLFGVRFFLN